MLWLLILILTLIIKPTRCTNFSILFLEWNSTCFGQFLCPSSAVFHCTHSNGICHAGLLTACELYSVQWKTADDEQRNCPKHVEFYSKNKFEELVHLVGFIIRIYHDTRSPEGQNFHSLTSIKDTYLVINMIRCIRKCCVPPYLKLTPAFWLQRVWMAS